MFVIYKVTNNITNKNYIGITNQGLMHRFREHEYRAKTRANRQSILYKSIRLYGFENFSITQLDSASTAHEGFALERKYIKELNTKTPNGYNLTDGGEGAPGIKRTQREIEYHKRRCSKPVMRSDGKVFPSITEAARETKTFVGNIRKAIEGIRGSAGGYTWSLLINDPSESRKKERIRRTKFGCGKKAVVCINTGIEYESASQAARELGLDFRQISAVVCNRRKEVKGLQFKFV